MSPGKWRSVPEPLLLTMLHSYTILRQPDELPKRLPLLYAQLREQQGRTPPAAASTVTSRIPPVNRGPGVRPCPPADR